MYIIYVGYGHVLGTRLALTPVSYPIANPVYHDYRSSKQHL